MTRLTLAAAALIAGATGAAANDVWGSDSESTGVGFNYGGEGCDSYDDDNLYTAQACGQYDTGACANDCGSGGWCDLLCGSGNTSCADGGGAICATDRLSKVLETCLIIEAKYNYTLPRGMPNSTWTDDDDSFSEPTGNGSHVHKNTQHGGNSQESGQHSNDGKASEGGDDSSSSEVTEDPSPDETDGAMDGDHESLRMPKPTDPTGERRLAHNDLKAGAIGCDAHVYCEYCGKKCDEVMHEYAKKLWGVSKWQYNYEKGGAGPMSMKLLNDMPALCKEVYPEGAQAYIKNDGKRDGVLTVLSDDSLDRPWLEKREDGSEEGSEEGSTTTTQDNIHNMKKVADEAGTGAGAGTKNNLELVSEPGKSGAVAGSTGWAGSTVSSSSGGVSGELGWSTDDRTPGGIDHQHEHTDSCGKGCTETVVDDDTTFSGDATATEAPNMAKVNAPDARLPDGAVQASPEEPAPLVPDLAATEPGSAGVSGSSAVGLAGAAVLAVAGVALVAFLVKRRRAGFAAIDNTATVYDAI